MAGRKPVVNVMEIWRKGNLTEEMLVKQMKKGDKASFDMLYEKYKNMALHTAYLITGDYSYSEDVVQDTFVKVYLHCKELKNDSGFRAWMMQILVRTAYKCGRKKSRELPDDEVTQKMDTGRTLSSLEQVIMQEEAEAITQAVRKLPVKQRTVVVLYYYQEYQISEIAQIVGCLEGTVKSRLHTARKKLKSVLKTELRTTVSGVS
jgi:RNA polymerase sigma-70 factor (ECF subfamily)